MPKSLTMLYDVARAGYVRQKYQPVCVSAIGENRWLKAKGIAPEFSGAVNASSEQVRIFGVNLVVTKLTGDLYKLKNREGSDFILGPSRRNTLCVATQ